MDLRGTPISADGAAAIAAILPALAGSLKHFALFYPTCAASAAGVLAPALAQAKGLVQLLLGGFDFGPQGAQLVPVLVALLCAKLT